MIFTAHDYASGEKGEVCVELMSKHYRRARECTWFLPEAEPIEVAPGLLIEEATAAMVPISLSLRSEMQEARQLHGRS